MKKTNEAIIKQSTQHCSPGILVFSHQSIWWNYNWVTPNLLSTLTCQISPDPRQYKLRALHAHFNFNRYRYILSLQKGENLLIWHNFKSIILFTLPRVHPLACTTTKIPWSNMTKIATNSWWTGVHNFVVQKREGQNSFRPTPCEVWSHFWRGDRGGPYHIFASLKHFRYYLVLKCWGKRTFNFAPHNSETPLTNATKFSITDCTWIYPQNLEM